MSQENAAIVRRVYEDWSQGNFRTLDVYDPDVVFIDRMSIDAGTYLGRDGVKGYMKKFLEQWSDVTMRARELIEAGESVIVAVEQHAVGRTSGIPTELNYFHVWTLRSGMVIRIDILRERAEALEAVGLSE